MKKSMTTQDKKEITNLIRDVIREELFDMNKLDRFAFQKNLHILDKYNILTGKKNGCQIATETTQKIGFYGTTPVVQASAITDPSGEGAANDRDTEARAACSSIITALHNLGLIA